MSRQTSHKEQSRTVAHKKTKPDHAGRAQAEPQPETLHWGLSNWPSHDTARPLRQAAILRQQQRHGNAFVQRLLVQRADGKAAKEPKLLTDFAAKFADSAALIRTSPEAMKLVREAAKAGVKFGGYSEDGPAKWAWPYTAGNKVYVPRAQTDKVVASSDFLFELNNAIRKPIFAGLDKKATKGTITAKEFAYKNVEQEVEGMLRTGKIWFEMKKSGGKGKKWGKYDADFYLSEYKAYKAGKKTKDDLIKDVLKRTYPSGKHAGKTVEQYYIEQHKALKGGK